MEFLDNPETYRQYDPQNMLRHLHDIPTMCQDAWRLVSDFHLPADYRQANKVVVMGMGGSAIGADLAAGMNESTVPVIIQRGYTLPGFVDEDTLVITSSHSGATEETISAFHQARATRAKIIVMANGQLGQMAAAMALPVFGFNYQSPPRASLPYSFLPLLGILQQLGFMPALVTDVSEFTSVLTDLSARINETVPMVHNPAKKLAQEMPDKMVYIYGAEFLTGVAHRWKLQINENAKAWAGCETFPELNHNTVVGYTFPRELTRATTVVMLYSPELYERLKIRYPITRELLRQAGATSHTVTAEGRSKLAQMLSLILFGDYVSYYLALLYRTDPYPLDAVDYLKSELAKQPGNDKK
jgi:glucose/mannose-6-phosphate isomerase